jgi:hypothetical protein
MVDEKKGILHSHTWFNTTSVTWSKLLSIKEEVESLETRAICSRRIKASEPAYLLGSHHTRVKFEAREL